MNPRRLFQAGLFLLMSFFAPVVRAQTNELKSSAHWLPAHAFLVPPETAPEGEGYFSIITGHNGRLYIGTHANAKNAWLVELDPVTGKMKPVVDAQQAVGSTATGFAAQAKIHTRNNVGASGKIYFATKQGYPSKTEKPEDYPGGYPMTYDPATGQTTVYPIALPHQGIISIMPDESRGLAYLSTCSDTRPRESTHFMVLDLKTRQYKDLLDCEHSFACIVLDDRGRAYHPIRGGEIARYDPDTGTLDRLKQTIDGAAPAKESVLADENSHPITWDVSPDKKTLYAQPMNANQLYAYDLTAKGDTLPGRSLGALLPGAISTDCRAMCVGPKGTVWCAVTTPAPEDGRGFHALHLIRYQPGLDHTPADLGHVYVENPDFTTFKDDKGKTLPYHGGFAALKDGRLVPMRVNLGLSEGKDGALYSLALQPYTVLRIQPPKTE